MDYTYNFDSQYSEKINIQIKNQSFRWPEFNKKADTVFLKLNVRQKRINSAFLPYLKITSNKQTVKQYLERKNTGARYFNLSFLLANVKTNEFIHIKSNKLNWSANAELIFFENNISETRKKEKVLVISPHPDDAELAAFGFYSNYDSHIVTITAGESGKTFYHDYYPNNLIKQNQLKAKLRIFDSLFVPSFGNVCPEKTINLGYFDDTLSNMYSKPNMPAISAGTNINNINQFRAHNISRLLPKHNGAATWKNLIKDLSAIISSVCPDIIVLPHPTLDKNSDHRYTAIAAFEAAKNINALNGKYYFYVNHSAYSARYPYGKIHTPITLPPNFNEFNMPCSIYSSPMSYDARILKSFALDTIHDLKHLPNYQFKFRRFFSNKYKHLFAWRDYFRKSIRLNELFIVLPMNQTADLLGNLLS